MAVSTQDPVKLLQEVDQGSERPHVKILETPFPMGKEMTHSVPFSAEWTLVGLRMDDCSHVVAVLMDWVHPRWRREVDEVTVVQVATLDDGQALDALKKFRNQWTFRQGHGKSLILKVQVSAPRGVQVLHTLVDSGCEGSCIHCDVVKRLGLKTTQLTHPIPVFNADGQPNVGGLVREMVRLEMEVQGRWERSTFAVVELGAGELFLGYDWLHIANPFIDWQMGQVLFQHCVALDPDEEAESGLSGGHLELGFDGGLHGASPGKSHVNTLATPGQGRPPCSPKGS
jgi:hypothetical protein